ncbi:kinesin-like protein KIF18A [Scylla paramamosain]|uniref:kinesin-like protein KIF18A n=1 Tax=Scylla paramamosain TaxID=85552 RepID=UPI0030828757
MTKNRQALHRVNSPIKSPRRHNSSLRKKALVRRISGEVQFGAASKANLKVVVRVRPQNQREEDKGARCVVDVLDKHMLVFDPKEETGDGFFFKGTKQRCRDLSKRQPLEKKFVFEHVFGDQATNEELYEVTAHPLIDTLLQGYNCSVFAYGATGAGKTYTMLGRPECPGITSLTLQELYQQLDELKGQKRCEVAVSYLEVYNETVRDLLGTGKPLALQEMGQQVMVPGLSLHKPSNAEELLQMLAQGNSNRTQHATDANAESSRSHAVFQIFVRQQDLEASAKATVTISKLSMIDLAGSERGAATGFRGVRFKEGSSINKSLLALGNCINALADGQRHIPYRDSKLTRLLKDSLGGNCRSVMIAAISPASTSFEDTYNTLRYAERAKTIRTTIRNNVKNVDQHVSDYIKVVAGLREEVTSLREKLKEYQAMEEEWKTERSELKAAALQPLASTPEVEVEGAKEEIISEEEIRAQKQLQDVSAEQKALRQELLLLEASYKATELKRCHWVARLARVQVVAFASSKLDKTLKKCERTINALDNRLSQTSTCIETLKKKVTANLTKMQEAQEALSYFGPEPGHLSKDSQSLVERHEASIALRDSHQLGEHLQTLLQEDFKEQHTSEQLVHVLLGVVRDLYLQHYEKDQNCPKARSTFQHVVDGLDECRIAWADQQSVAKEGDGQAPSNGQPVGTQLNADHFTSLPSLTTSVISPTIMIEPHTSFRKSSLMSSVSTSILPHHQPLGNSWASVTSSTLQPQPLSPPPKPVQDQKPQNTGEERSLNTTTTVPTSPVLSSQATQMIRNMDEKSSILTANAAAGSGLQQDNLLTSNTATGNTPSKLLNTTYDSVPYASRLSSITIPTTPSRTVSTASSPFMLQSLTMPSSLTRPLNTTIDIPSTGSCITPISADPSNTCNLPSNTKLSAASRVLNATIDVHSPTVLSTHTPKHHPAYSTSGILSMAHSETKLLQRTSSTSQLSHTDAHLATLSQVDAGPVISALPSSTTTTTTTTTTSGPAVARQLFSGDKAGLNATFNVSQADGPEDLSTRPSSSDQLRSPGTVDLKSAATRSPLVPVTNRFSHSNLLTIPEKQPMKPPLIKGFRGIGNRRGMTRTPHKSLAQSFTPRKEAGMRRSVSTPSLVSQQASSKHLSSTTKKLKGLGGTLHRTSSFLKGKNNQENMPPHHTRRPSVGVPRPASPSSHPKSPGLLHKA